MTKSEWNYFLTFCRVSRSQILPLKPFFEIFPAVTEYDLGEPSGSILVKANLRIFREREISNLEQKTCGICFDEFEKDSIVKTKCHHFFCKDCFSRVSTPSTFPFIDRCPSCRCYFDYNPYVFQFIDLFYQSPWINPEKSP